jgi:hypothetical protein
VNVAIYQFYNQVSKLETTTPEFIKELIGKLPPLAWVAKQTGDPEFKDSQVTLKDADNLESCAGDIVNWADCEAALRGLVNDTAKVFQVHEKDILEPVGGKPEEEPAPPPQVEEAPPPNPQVEELPHVEEEVPPPIEEELISLDDLMAEPVTEEEDMFNLVMPSESDIPLSVIKKVDFGDTMSDQIDIDDLI